MLVLPKPAVITVIPVVPKEKVTSIRDFIDAIPSPVLGAIGERIIQFNTISIHFTILYFNCLPKEEYDQWRYKHPELDTSKHWAKVPSQTVSNMLMEEFQKIEKEEKKTAKKKKQK